MKIAIVTFALLAGCGSAFAPDLAASPPDDDATSPADTSTGHDAHRTDARARADASAPDSSPHDSGGAPDSPDDPATPGDGAIEAAADVPPADAGDAGVDVLSFPKPPLTVQSLGAGCNTTAPPDVQCRFGFYDDAGTFISWPLVCFAYPVPLDGYDMFARCSLVCDADGGAADCLAAGWKCAPVPGYPGAPDYCAP